MEIIVIVLVFLVLAFGIIVIINIDVITKKENTLNFKYNLPKYCPYCESRIYTDHENFICKNCGMNVNLEEYVRKVVFDIGYGYENNSDEAKVLDSLELISKGINYSEIYINISKYSGEIINNLIIDLISNPPKIGLENIKLFIKGENKEISFNINNIIDNNNYINVKKIILNIGCDIIEEPSTLLFNFFDDFNLEKKLNNLSAIHINSYIVHEKITNSLFKYLSMKYYYDEISSVNFYLNGEINKFKNIIETIERIFNNISRNYEFENTIIDVGFNSKNYQSQFTFNINESENVSKLLINEIIINTASDNHNQIQELVAFLNEQYNLDELSNINFYLKGNMHELVYLINNLHIKNILLYDDKVNDFIKVEKTIIDIGAKPELTPSIMNLQFEKDFNLTKKIDFSEIYINTVQNYHRIIEKLITYLMEKYTQKEISNMKLFVEGSLDALPLNIKNAIGNNFKVL